jgi:hypothetical protein
MTDAVERSTRSLGHWLGIDGARRSSGNLRVDAPTPARCELCVFCPRQSTATASCLNASLAGEPEARSFPESP